MVFKTTLLYLTEINQGFLQNCTNVRRALISNRPRHVRLDLQKFVWLQKDN